MADFRPAARWLALVGVCLGVFMFTLDASIVNIAVPTLIRELHTTISAVQWVIQAYLAVIVVLLLPLSRLASRVGRKRLFLAGIVFFVAGSFLCGTADSMGSLVGFRVVQAVGAACISSLMSSIVNAAFPAGRLAQALGIVAATATLGTSLGPTIGGFLIDAASWHAIFLVNVPVGVVAFALVATMLPSSSSRPAADAPALKEFFSLLGNGRVRVGVAGRMATMMANGALLFLAPLLLENALRYSTWKAGLFLAASPIIVGITSPIFGSLADRFGRGRFLAAGLAGMIGGMLVMRTLSPDMSEAGFLLRVAVWGIGMGIFNAPNAADVMAAAPGRLADGASALLSLAIVLGQLVGVAAGGALFRRLAFGAHEGAVIDLAPAALAGAVGGALCVFALPFAGLVFADVFVARKQAA